MKKGMRFVLEKRPIVIICAIDKELDFLLKNLDKRKLEKVNIYEFYEGEFYNYPVVIVYAKVGVINATLATYISITKYNPIAIINAGIGGAHSKDIHVKDVIIGEECFNIVSCRTPEKSIGEGSNSLEWTNLSFIADEENRELYWKADKRLVDIAKNTIYEEGKKYVGVIGSGDIWNNEADRILMLNQKYRTLCEEMEGIGIYTVANNFQIPVLGIRVISNNEILGEKYDRNTGLYSQKFAYELIKNIINSENFMEK